MWTIESLKPPKDFDMVLMLDDENEITSYEIGDIKLTPNRPRKPLNPQTRMYLSENPHLLLDDESSGTELSSESENE